MTVTHHPRATLAAGSFDGGRIREIKPLGFPGEAAPVLRLGPLFYWAWAEAAETAFIDEHPHQSFEIVTYVLEGRVEHRDSLGTVRALDAGGAQLMLTGSGVWHSERILEAPASLLQIWLEPDRKRAIKQPPRYLAADAAALPRSGGLVTVFGKDSPLAGEAPAALYDVTLEAGEHLCRPLAPGEALGALTIDGTPSVDATATEPGSFVVVTDCEAARMTGPGRLVFVELPLKPGYALYHKARPKL